MDTKIIVIITIAAAVAIGGGTIAAVVLLNDNGDSLDADVIRTEVSAGDYIEYALDGTVSGDTTRENVGKTILLTSLYSYTGTKDANTQNVTYKGTTIACNVYRYTLYDTNYVFYVHPTTSVIYSETVTDDDGTSTTTLIDTNLDLTVGSSSQNITSGTFIKYSSSSKTSTYEAMNVIVEYRMLTYNSTTDKGSLNVSTTGSVSGTMRYEVSEINAAGKLIYKDDDETHTVLDFLSNVSYDKYLEYEKEEVGNTIVDGESTSDVIETEFGKRKVTIQSFTMTDEDGQKSNNKITYGKNGVIYILETSGISDGLTINATATLKSSNLISVG